MRIAIVIGVVALGVSGCNRMHLYKKAGQATVAAFAAQAAGSNAPQPRGIDGQEAPLILKAQQATFAGGDDDGPGANSGPPGGGAKPLGIPLQAR